MSWYESTYESVVAHWLAMGEEKDDGLCITLCMRRRQPRRVFCEVCRHIWAGRPGDTHQWIIDQRVINTSLSLWPSWA